MKRKRQEGDEELFSDDNTSKVSRNMKVPKMNGCTSPLLVIHEHEELNYSTITAEVKNDEEKRPTRASSRLKANSQPKRQQPKRNSKRKNGELESIGYSSMDEKPRKNTRGTRKKNLLDLEVFKEENNNSSSPDTKLKRTTSDSRKKNATKSVPVQEQQPCKPASPEKKAAANSTMTSFRESITPFAVVKEEELSFLEEQKKDVPVSPKIKKEDCSGSKAVTEILEQHVLEALASPIAPSNYRAVCNLVLKSPVISSSPCVHKVDGMPAVKDVADHMSNLTSLEETQAFGESTVAEGLTNPPQAEQSMEVTSAVGCIKRKEISESICGNETLPHLTENLSNFIEPESDKGDINIASTTDNLDAGDCPMDVKPKVKSTRGSIRQSSGWRRKSRRSSHRLSLMKGPLSIHKSATKSKSARKKSLVKSSVKLKLTQSKLIPELKRPGSTSVKSANRKPLDGEAQPELADVRVRLFNNSNSDSGAEDITVSPVKERQVGPQDCTDCEVFEDALEFHDKCDDMDKVQEVVTSEK